MTPTRTFRNRAGEAPCPVCAICPGCPFPQLGVPHIVQYFSLQTASQLLALPRDDVPSEAAVRSRGIALGAH